MKEWVRVLGGIFLNVAFIVGLYIVSLLLCLAAHLIMGGRL